MSNVPIIELSGVSYRQNGNDILHAVSWRVGSGQHWAILGPNGSGKSTLLRLAGGYLWPMSGVIKRLGKELVDLRELRRSIGWVSADLAAQMPPDETVLNVVVSARFAQLGIREGDGEQPALTDLAAAEHLLVLMGCAHLRDRTFGTLSQGERQQILVARARAISPLMIVLDEPCAGMDPGARERFLAWLEARAGEAGGPALVLVTHHVEELLPCFESTLIMRAGTVAACGPTAAVVTAQSIASLYGVDVLHFEQSSGRYSLVCRARADT